MQRETPWLVSSGFSFPVRSAGAAVAAGLLFAFEAACKHTPWLSEFGFNHRACPGETLATVAVLGCDW